MPTANGKLIIMFAWLTRGFFPALRGPCWVMRKEDARHKKRENYQSCKGHESSKWLQRHITYYIQQNSLRWSSQFGMQEHLICALHTIQKFQEKMAHILLQGQRTFRTSSSTAFVIECGTFRSCWILMNKKTQGQIIKIDAKRPSTIKHSSSFSSYDIVFTKVLPPQLDFLWAFIG